MKHKFFALCLFGLFLGAVLSAYEESYAATILAIACGIWICNFPMREKGQK